MERKKEKLLLIVPPNINFSDFIAPPANVKVSTRNSGKSYGCLITDMPLGVISLSAYIKKHLDVEITAIDFNVELNKCGDFRHDSFKAYFHDVLKEKLASFEPTVIGISTLFSTAYRSLIHLSEVCKELSPQTFLVSGGNIPTVSYKEIFKSTGNFDAVCHGEGEVPLLNLLKADDKKAYVQSDKSWITKEKILTETSFDHNFIENLDEIPFDYSLIKHSDYEINPTIRYYSSVSSKGNSFNIMTSRGCPFKCIFCAAHKTHGRRMRYHSLERIKHDILVLKNDFGVKVITIEDDHFMGDKQRAFEIIKFIGEQGITAFFPNSLAMYALTRDILEALKGAGVEQLILAVESGSDEVLRKVMKKPLKLDIVTRVAKDCREIGIYTDCNIVMGLPGETKKDMDDTRAFLKTVGANWFRINVATPLLGSEMFEICEEKDYLKGEIVDCNYKKAIVETEDFTAKFIQENTYDMNIDLNFVHNTDMRLGNFLSALKGFENTLKAKPDHAIALYYASLCYKGLGESQKSEEYLAKAIEAYSQDSAWDKFVEKYAIPLDKNYFSDAEQPERLNSSARRSEPVKLK